MDFLRHPALLWLKKFQKEKLPQIDESLQDIFDSGHKFEEYVEKLYPDGVKHTYNGYQEYLGLFKLTKEEIEKGTKTILQGAFQTNGLTCIPDILDKNPDGSYDLIEIKTSTKVKEEQKYDLAFQTVVLEENGVKVSKIHVLFVNNQYVRNGEIDPAQISTKEEVTEDVKNLIEITKEQIIKAKQILQTSQMPSLSPKYANQLDIKGTSWFGYWLEIYKHLNPDLDKYSIYNLIVLNPTLLEKLEERGVENIKDIPEDIELNEKQLRQVKTTKTGQRIIDKEKIKEYIDSFEYPIYFLDYETLTGVIPPFDGMKPYQQVPFQYSLHVLEKPGEEVKHYGYLHNENSNPITPLTESLKSHIGEKGTVLVWNEGFEKGKNEDMGERDEESFTFYEDLNNRIKDLMIPFSKGWFTDKDFFGSASLKPVLPVVVPELSYKVLEIQGGSSAQRIWMKTILEGENEDEKEKILENLDKYCELDTYAMVRILEELQKICQ